MSSSRFSRGTREVPRRPPPELKRGAGQGTPRKSEIQQRAQHSTPACAIGVGGEPA